jgi:hypothetical protein
VSECKHETWNSVSAGLKWECGECGKFESVVINELQQQLTSERDRADKAERMLRRANEALERAGSAGQFSSEIKIPEDALAFAEYDYTLSYDLEDEPAYSKRQWDEQQATIAAMRSALEATKEIPKLIRAYDDEDEPTQEQAEDLTRKIFTRLREINAMREQALSNTANTEYADKLKQMEYKLNTLADQYKKLEHEKTLLNMALRAANDGNDTTDLRYSYVPGVGPEQLDSLCHGVIVHIPVDWLKGLINTNKSNTEHAERVKKLEEGGAGFDRRKRYNRQCILLA